MPGLTTGSSDHSIRPRVLAIHFSTEVNPVTQDWLNHKLESAQADGYAAANGATVLPVRLGADEQHFLRAARLPRGYMRSMQVHFSCSVAGSDDNFGQPPVPLDDPGR